jgi:hypothetical protein
VQAVAEKLGAGSGVTPPWSQEGVSLSVKPPWSPEQVAALNAWQQDQSLHPFTCGLQRGDAAHVAYQQLHPDQDLGQLVASPHGWYCPVPGCAYTQQWAHAGMFRHESLKND